MAVAGRPEVDASYLRRFMVELHLPMPTYRLEKAEQESVIEYILSLRAQTREGAGYPNASLQALDMRH